MLSLLFQYYYLINIGLAVFLLAVIGSSKSIEQHLFCIFTYFTFHYTYGYLPVFAADFGTQYAIQRSANHHHASVVAVVFLMLAAVIMGLKHVRHINSIKKNALFNPIAIGFLIISSIWLLLSIANLMVYWAPGQSGVVFINGFLIFSTCLALLISNVNQLKSNPKILVVITRYTFGLLVIMVLAQGYEFISGRSWVCCDLVRTSAFLFNPNNLGFWLLTLSAYFFFTYAINVQRCLSMVAYVLIAISLMLSAPRSFLVDIMVFHLLILFSSVLFKRRQVYPRLKIIMLFYSLMVAFCFGLQFIWFTPLANSLVWNRLQLNADRFLYTPAIIYQFITHDDQLTQYIDQLSTISTEKVRADFVQRKRMLNKSGYININNRFSTESTDNAFLTLLQTGSKVTNTLWLFILFLPVVLVLNRQFMNNIGGQVLIAYYITELVSGFSMNIFVIFPAWAILGITYAVCMAALIHYYSKSISAKKTYPLSMPAEKPI